MAHTLYEALVRWAALTRSAAPRIGAASNFEAGEAVDGAELGPRECRMSGAMDLDDAEPAPSRRDPDATLPGR